jgi:hypothetical protein
MDLPRVKKRISDFIFKEEGRISKQSLVSMGAFLGGAAIGMIGSSKEVHAQFGDPIAIAIESEVGLLDSDSGSSQSESCYDLDWDKGCPGREPGGCGPVSKTAAEGQNAYNAGGSQIYVGDGYCADDVPFHFNGIDFSYASQTLTAKHHHHGSHNSY